MNNDNKSEGINVIYENKYQKCNDNAFYSLKIAIKCD